MNQLAVRLSLMAMATLLMAPRCKSVYPNTPTNPFPPGDFRQKQQSVEPKLVDAGANSVLALGFSSWSYPNPDPSKPNSYLGIEPCNRCVIGQVCVYPTANGTHDEWVGATQFKCSWNTADLDAYLDTHSDPFGSRTTTRHYMVQLGIYFHAEKHYPPYITATLDSSTFQTKFRRMWDKVLPVLSQHRAAAPPPGDRLILIGLGNEVNQYLNHVAGNPTNAWAQYKAFLQSAIGYINSTSNFTFETATLQWFESDTPQCGIGNVVHGSGPCNIQPQQDVLALSDTHTYTYYPPSSLNAGTLQQWVHDDFATMALAGAAAGKPVIIQEAGYPSTGASTTQDVFINALFNEWANFANNIFAVNYFALHDHPNFFTTGLHSNTGAPKPSWTTFKTRMSQVQ